jgi:hypothetical protein
MPNARDRILPPYTRRLDDLRHLATKALLIVGLIMSAMLMGFWLAVFGTFVAQPFIGLIGLLFLLALWLADDTEPDYRRQVTKLLFVFLGLEMIWPPYLAFDLPGLPWITPPRIALALLVFMGLIQMAQSSRARAELVGVLKSAPLPMVSYLLFWILAFAAAFIGSTPGSSLGETISSLLLWNMSFVLALWVMTDEQSFPRFVRLMLFAFSFVFVLTVFEYMQRKPIWFDYIPGFLKIDGPLFAALMAEQGRVGDDRYRARGNLGVHLYFAQALLLTVPFMVHYALASRRLRTQAVALALLGFTLVITWMTNTRTGMTGFILMALGGLAVFALRRFLNPTSKADMVAPALFMAAPAGAVVMMALIAASPRLQTMTLGGAQHRGSDEGRDRQWDKAIDALSQNPFGYGGGNSGPLAGRLGAADIWIVDSAWINLLLDYGVLAALGFAILLASTAWFGVRLYLRGGDEAADLCGPAAVSLGGFALTMYTISYFGNFALMLMLVAGILGTRYRLGLADAQARPVKSPPPLTLGPRRMTVA